MKVALINAPRLIFSGDIYSLTSPPLGLAHLYGYLTQKGIDSDLIDFNVELMKNKKIFVCFNNIDSSLSLEDFCLKYKTIVDETVNYLLSKVDLTKYGLLGMSVLENQSLKIIVPLLKKIKSLNPEIKIVLGGSLPIEDKYLLEGLIDFLVLDYGEEALYSIIKSLQKKDNLSNLHFQFLLQMKWIKLMKKL